MFKCQVHRALKGYSWLEAPVMVDWAAPRIGLIVELFAQLTNSVLHNAVHLIRQNPVGGTR